MTVKKHLLAISLFTSAITITSNASADWSGGIEAGAVLGSSDRPALRFYANNASNPLSHYAYIDWIRESGGSNYRIGYNPTFRVSHSIYSFGRFSLEQDDPSGVDREINAYLGVGNNLFQRGNTRIKIEAGLGAQQLQFDDSSDETDGFAFVSGSLRSSLLALLRFDASVSAKANDESRNFEGEAGLSIPIAPGTKLRYVYQVQRYNFDGRENIVNEDNFFKVSYGF